MKITRRKAIALGVAGTGAAALAAGTGWVARDTIKAMPKADALAYLKSEFEYLQLDMKDEQFQSFIDDYYEHYRRVPRKLYRRIRSGDPDDWQRYGDHLCSIFLCSTNFFLNDADESKPVRYVRFYHPYVSPCWNPFSLAETRRLAGRA